MWSDNEIVIPITVLPPPWHSWWAYALYAFSLLIAAALFIRYRDGYVRNRVRLEQADEDKAALTRLEDGLQEQQELTDRILNAIKPRSHELLGAVRTLIDAQASSVEGAETTALIDLKDRLSSVEIQERVTQHTSQGSSTNLHALVNELIDATVLQAEEGRNAILLNDTAETEVPAEHARYLAPVIHELLALMLAQERLGPSDVIRLEVAPPAALGTISDRYRVLVENREQAAIEDAALERALPVTLHLIESLGGRITRDSEFGERLEIQLSFQ